MSLWYNVAGILLGGVLGNVLCRRIFKKLQKVDNDSWTLLATLTGAGAVGGAVIGAGINGVLGGIIGFGIGTAAGFAILGFCFVMMVVAGVGSI